MFIHNDIVYAGNPVPLLTIKSVRSLTGYKLLIRFSNGVEKEIDFLSLLDEPVYQPLKDLNVFNSVYIDYGTIVWNDGMIDIAPEYLYENY